MRIIVHDNQWQQAMAAIDALSKRTIADQLNQAALDVSGYAFDSIPPADPGASRGGGKRGEIRAHLTEELAVRVRLAKRGKRKGQFIRVGSKFFSNSRSKGKDRSLRRIHLILNAARGNRGKKGLYGKEMRAMAGSVVGRRTRGVGFLKGAFIPVIRALNPLVKYKFPVGKTRNIARWPGSAADGFARPAKDGSRPMAIVTTAPTVHGSGQDGKVRRMYEMALNSAIAFKTGKLVREATRALQRVASGQRP